MDPKFVVINWSKGSVVAAVETESEARDQLKKACRNGEHYLDTYLLAEVRVHSEMKRVES